MYVGVTRAQRSLSISWCQKRKRGKDFEKRVVSRFIDELALGSAPFAPAQSVTPGERLAGLKALLNQGKTPPQAPL
jgi:ATP-dependent DNA helicase Rep